MIPGKLNRSFDDYLVKVFFMIDLVKLLLSDFVLDGDRTVNWKYWFTNS
jgi:hypothetical protein